jgi:aspartate 1-decarboxylase
MLRFFCKSKIHGATITHAELQYEGSITIDDDLLRAADMMPYERVQVVNLNNGQRLETYVIRGKAGSGVVGLNGPAARMGMIGDRVHIISYAAIDAEEASFLEPQCIHVDGSNRAQAPK